MANLDRWRFSGDVLDGLFSRSAPSSAFAGDDPNGYCSRDVASGSYAGCSYSVVDGSPDGVLAIGTGLAIVDGRVLLTSAGFAEWND